MLKSTTMSVIRSIESLLNTLFKNVPELPKEGHRAVADIWPLLAMMLALLQILAVAGLWYLSQSMQIMSQESIHFQGLTDGPLPISTQIDYMLVYSGMGLLILSALLFILASIELKKRTKKAWDLLLMAIIVNLLYGVLLLFIDSDGRGIKGFSVAAVGSLAGLYLLQQTKELYIKQTKSKLHH